MTITKNSLIMMIFFLTIKHCLAKSANSQQPTANSQQPTANSQQPTANSQILIKTIFYFTLINLLMKRVVSEIFFAIRSHCKLSVGCSFFMSWRQFVMLNSFQHPRKKEILKQVQNDSGKNLPVWEVKINRFTKE